MPFLGSLFVAVQRFKRAKKSNAQQKNLGVSTCHAQHRCEASAPACHPCTLNTKRAGKCLDVHPTPKKTKKHKKVFENRAVPKNIIRWCNLNPSIKRGGLPPHLATIFQLQMARKLIWGLGIRQIMSPFDGKEEPEKYHSFR